MQAKKKHPHPLILHVKPVAACLNSRTGFTHVEWLYCILHSKSKATAPWMWSNAALNWIVVSDVSSRLWVVGSNCWCWCFALSNMALQLFDLVDRLNMMPRETGLVPSYCWWKSLEMFFTQLPLSLTGLNGCAVLLGRKWFSENATLWLK